MRAPGSTGSRAAEVFATQQPVERLARPRRDRRRAGVARRCRRRGRHRGDDPGRRRPRPVAQREDRGSAGTTRIVAEARRPTTIAAARASPAATHEAELVAGDLGGRPAAERAGAGGGQRDDDGQAEHGPDLGARREQAGGEPLVGTVERRGAARGRRDGGDAEPGAEEDEAARQRGQRGGAGRDGEQRERAGRHAEQPGGHRAGRPDRRGDAGPGERAGDDGEVEGREQQAGGGGREAEHVLRVERAQEHRRRRRGGEDDGHEVRLDDAGPAQQRAVEQRVGGAGLDARERREERERRRDRRRA